MVSQLNALKRKNQPFFVKQGPKALGMQQAFQGKPPKPIRSSSPHTLANPSQTASYKLASIDAMVRAHEHAHLMALGPYAAGSIEYDYAITPSGMRYAVGGSIAVDLRPVPGDPEATLRKAKAVLLSALAPASPSTADKEIAAKAIQLMQQAKRELDQGQTEMPSENNPTPLKEIRQAQAERFLLSTQTPEEALHRARQLKAEALEAEGQQEKIRLALKAYQLEILAQRLKAKEKQDAPWARLNLLI